MATVTAFIRTLKTDKNKSVNVRFRLRDGRDFQLFHKSEFSVFPDKWDEKQQKIKARCIIDEQERKTFDTGINDRKALIKSIYIEKGKILTSDLLDTEIDKTLHPENYETPPTAFFQFIDKFIKDSPNRTDKNDRTISSKTIMQYKVTNKHLREFAKNKNKTDYDFDEIDQEFYEGFVKFMRKKQFALNSISKDIKNIKVFLNDATKQGINSNMFYDKNFKVRKESADSIYLNEKELQQIKDADLSKTPHLDRVRDWFLLLAWTGCRFSDLEKIVKTDIKDGFISFRQQKTGDSVTIPLHPIVVEILEKYSYNLPEEISNQKFNEYIKEVCRISEINGTETITRTVGGKLITEKFDKWQLVSSHTGRRSFCTNMYKRGLPTLMIMSISGHRTEKSFLSYIKIKQEEHAEMMKKEWEKMYK